MSLPRPLLTSDGSLKMLAQVLESVAEMYNSVESEPNRIDCAFETGFPILVQKVHFEVGKKRLCI